MDEADDRTETDGKGLFIIRNGRKVAKYEPENGCRSFPDVVRNTPDGIKVEWPH